ncbi:MAG TPA: carboxypeptidase-like regulatory domain-containing protein [Candidatus Nanopelagicales bacterium]|nr:carboxypeptidase-like regulatory domain-containing protein [Candidatus Nanopelagicales bacterium]
MRAPGTGPAARTLLALAGAVVLGLGTATASSAAPLVPAASASPSGTSTVRGVLLLGTPGTPVAGAKVTLHGAATGADPLTLNATTDAKGRFVFGGLAGGDAWSYTVTTDRGSTQFSTDALAVKAGETATTTLATYDVTTDPAAVSRSEWLVWLDVEGSSLAVQQDLAIVNSGSTAYTGTTPVPDAPDGGKAAVTLPVATGATSLSYLGAFEVCCDAISGTTWEHTRPVPPGTSTGTLRYEAPSTSTLTFPVTTQTQAFTLLVPSGTQVSSDRLAASGTQTDRGTTYQVLKGGPFTAGTTITVTLGADAAGGSSSSSLPLVAGGVVLLLAVAAVAWWLLRRRRTPTVVTPPTTGSAKAAGAKPGAAKAGAAKAGAKASSAKNGAAKAGATQAGSAKAGATQAGRAKAGTTQAGRSAPTSGAEGGTKAAARAAAPPGEATRATAPEAAAAPTAAVAATAARPADGPDVLADELAMLDLAHESGALPDEESYQRVRSSLVERLVAALGEDPDALSR